MADRPANSHRDTVFMRPQFTPGARWAAGVAETASVSGVRDGSGITGSSATATGATVKYRRSASGCPRKRRIQRRTMRSARSRCAAAWRCPQTPGTSPGQPLITSAASAHRGQMASGSSTCGSRSPNTATGAGVRTDGTRDHRAPPAAGRSPVIFFAVPQRDRWPPGPARLFPLSNGVQHKAGVARPVLVYGGCRLRHAHVPEQSRLQLAQLHPEAPDLHLVVEASEVLQVSVLPPAHTVPRAVHALARPAVRAGREPAPPLAPGGRGSRG